jgi:uncharacterized protein (TIGR03435 family)
MSWTTTRALISMAYHDPLPFEIVGLPAWAESERYDVEARGKAGASDEEVIQMWRALVADRLKLRVHYQTRPRPAYRLVLVRDVGRLGPQLRPSTCTPPDPGPTFVEMSNAARTAAAATIRERRAPTPREEAAIRAVCRPVQAWNAVYAGGVVIDAQSNGLLSAINLAGRPDRPIVDATGLHGTYAIALNAAPPSGGPPSADDPPTLLAALPAQLGLKLESTTIDGQVLVVDHIERPAEN